MTTSVGIGGPSGKLGGCWASSQLALYPHNKQDGQPFVFWNRFEDQGVYNLNLINESQVVFHNLQGIVQQCQSDTIEAKDGCAISMRYRSILQSCVHEIGEDIERGVDDTEEALQVQRQHFALMDLLWHLAEIFFIKSPLLMRSGGLVLTDLVDWVNQHFQADVDSDLSEILSHRGGQPQQHPRYWPSMYRLVLQGRLVEAREILKLHTLRRPDGKDEYGAMDELLASKPVVVGASSMDFLRRWHVWQNTCAEYRAKWFHRSPHLEKICAVLSGDESALTSLREYVPTWYQILVSKLLYGNPLVKMFDLQADVTWARSQFPGTDGDLDMMLLAVFEQDAHRVIRDSSQWFSDWWFSAHLADLLKWTGWLTSSKTVGDQSADLREFLIVEYASNLFTNSGLWSVGSRYLASCPVEGMNMLQLLLERLPLETDKKAIKVIRLCARYGLHDQTRHVCQVMGRRYLDQNRFGAGLNWYLQAKDIPMITKIADRLLEDFVQNGIFREVEVIEKLGPAMLLSPRLTFLAKYMQFHKELSKGRYEEAGGTLVTIIDAQQIAPKWLWPRLLKDALPLLEHPDLVFDTVQTQTLLKCVEELAMSHRHNDYLGSDEEATALLQPLRLALSRNLARALLM